MAANVANKSRNSRAETGTEYNQYPYLHRGKNSAYRTNVASHEPINSNPRINWFTLGSWSVMLIMCLAFWAGVISLFMGS